MKEQSSAELLNQWMGNPDYQSRWDRACHATLKRLIQKALSINEEALGKAEVKLTTSRRNGVAEVLLAVGEPESTIIRLTSSGKRPPKFELSTAIQRLEGRAAPQVIFSSEEGLSARSTRATVSSHLERAEERLEIAEAEQ